MAGEERLDCGLEFLDYGETAVVLADATSLLLLRLVVRLKVMEVVRRG